MSKGFSRYIEGPAVLLLSPMSAPSKATGLEAQT